MNPHPFVRGAPWPGDERVPYPRAKPSDRLRLPGDTWRMACIPVGVRLEVAGDAAELEVTYTTRTDELGYRGAGAGTTFASWTRAGLLGEAVAQLGEGTARVPLDPTAERTIVYLPEGMLPTVTELGGVGGDIVPPAPQPRWVVYGDSVAEGSIASAPALSWTATAAREQGLDLVNLGYAGAARGEVASAEQVAELRADVLTVCHGTNCWTRTPHSTGLFRAGLETFLDILRQEHPTTPLVVMSPVVRPDAETSPNRLGATLADLRAVMEEVAERRGDVELVRGLDLIGPEQLGDAIHPDDAGHAAIAAAVGPVVRGMIT